LNFALIPKFSYTGAAIATTLSFFLQLSLSVIYALREKIVMINMQPLHKIFLASLCMAALVFLAKKILFYDLNIFSLISLSAVGGFSYLALTQLLSVYKFKSLIKELTRSITCVPRP
jgi:O-antigen/teichoic acid export membrane protein